MSLNTIRSAGSSTTLPSPAMPRSTTRPPGRTRPGGELDGGDGSAVLDDEVEAPPTGRASPRVASCSSTYTVASAPIRVASSARRHGRRTRRAPPVKSRANVTASCRRPDADDADHLARGGRPRSRPPRTQEAGSTSTPAENETESGSTWTTCRGARTYSVASPTREPDLVVDSRTARSCPSFAAAATLHEDDPLADDPVADRGGHRRPRRLPRPYRSSLPGDKREADAQVGQVAVEHLEVGSADAGRVAHDDLAQAGRRRLELDVAGLVRTLDQDVPSPLDSSAGVDRRSAAGARGRVSDIGV